MYQEYWDSMTSDDTTTRSREGTSVQESDRLSRNAPERPQRPPGVSQAPSREATGSRARRSWAPFVAMLPLVVLAFVAGFGSAAMWMGPQLREGHEPRAPLVTATLLPNTPVPHPSPTPVLQVTGDELPSLYIDIAPREMATIEAKRDEALESWILQSSAADFVDATLRLGQDPPVLVRLRLKGDWGDHFTRNKWSYRVETRGGAALNGMTVFSLQDPSTRSYLNEWSFMRNLRDEGVLAVGYDFVNGVQNGVAMGVYAVEEGFSKELVESQDRREGVIIRYNEDLLWAYWAAYENDLSAPPGLNRFYIIDEFSSGTVASNPVLAAQRDIAVGKLRAWWQGDLPASAVYDTETMARFWALADLWGAQHAFYWHNLRFYYNPVTTLLEPIAFDAQPLGGDRSVDVETLPGLSQALAYDDARLQRAYVQDLWAFSQSEYVDDLERRYAGPHHSLRAALMPEFGDDVALDGTNVLDPPWDVLRKRQVALREILTPFQMTYVYRPPDVADGALWLDVGNLTTLPVRLVSVQVSDAVVPIDVDWLDPQTASGVVDAAVTGGEFVLKPLPRDATSMPYARLRIPNSVVGDVAPETVVHLTTQIWGLTQTVTQPAASAYPAPTAGPLPPALRLDAAVARYSFLRVLQDEDHMLGIAPGTWTITDVFALPEGYGLVLEPDTTLQFGPESFLLVRGPLSFRGTEASPIVLEPLDDVWRGVVVLDANRPSRWDHVTIRDTDAVNVDGWLLTGAVTFYQSPVSLYNVRFLGSRAEDALNVIRSEFVFSRVEFANTASDAFDGDFCQGQISDSVFHDIAGDGIDVSGSRVSVRNVVLRDLGDKGISTGEASHLSADNVTVAGADFGIVSKDRSHVEARDVAISEVRIAALAAYIKKPSYGPATMTVTGLTAGGVAPGQLTLVETGSWIDLDGSRVWGVSVDVGALYE